MESAVICQGDSSFNLLEAALDRAGFWTCLSEAAGKLSKGPEEFAIVIKPDMCLFERGASTATDPALVEHLVHLLFQRGYRRVTVACAPDATCAVLENRNIWAVAEVAGYRFVTSGGEPYELLDLSDDLVPSPFPEGSPLCGTPVGRCWVEAHFRISFAKSKTHDELVYAAALWNVLTVLAAEEPHRQYRARLLPWDVACELLRHTPVHFSLVDAVVSSDGSFGSRISRPLSTGTLIAGRDLLLTDWVVGMKMGVDPQSAPMTAKAASAFGVPDERGIAGDLSPYEGFVLPHPLLSDSLRKLGDAPELGRAFVGGVLSVDSELFPWKSPALEKLNGLLTPLARRMDESLLQQAVAIGSLAAWANAARALEAWQVQFYKGALRHRDVPLGISLSDFAPEDYARTEAYLEPLEALAAQTPGDAQGLSWRHWNGAILVRMTRILPHPFDLFVQRVDVAHSIQMMKDYIGGIWVATLRDESGRAVHQAERNIYLPQPNYVALYGGDVIDVTKVELIRRDGDEHKIFWRTVKSENDSAEFDDGSVSFRRHPQGTEVTLVALQKFALPPLLETMQLHLRPEIRNYLVEDAYRSYFDETLANFEICYEGGQYRVGRPWPADGRETTLGGWKEASASGLSQASRALSQVARALPGWAKKSSRPVPVAVDKEGFRHFEAPAADGAPRASSNPWKDALRMIKDNAQALSRDMGEAVRKDLGLPPEKARGAK